MPVSQQLYDALLMQPLEMTVFKPVALELLQMVVDPDINFFHVNRIIKEDQALATQVLSLANAPSYIGRSRCETIEAAAIRLGTQQLANIAIAASHASAHASEHPLVHDIMQELWMHSHACALGCRSLAMKAGHQGFGDHAYLAGLLHDVGKLGLLKAMERVSRMRVDGCVLSKQLLSQVFGELHVEFGGHMMTELNLPLLYRDIVTRHHDAYNTDDDILINVVRLVNCNSRRFRLNHYPTQDQIDETSCEAGAFQLDEAAQSRLREVMTGAWLG